MTEKSSEMQYAMRVLEQAGKGPVQRGDKRVDVIDEGPCGASHTYRTRRTINTWDADAFIRGDL